MDWSKLPDLAAVTLLIIAFASVARSSRMQISGLWLTGWMMIALHFGFSVFNQQTGPWGAFAAYLSLITLIYAGLLFMWASVSYRHHISSRVMFVIELFTNTLYMALISYAPHAYWALAFSAVLYGILPLAIALSTLRILNHPLRWTLTGLYCGLAVYLLLVQTRANGVDLAVNGVLFTIYLSCSIHLWFASKRATAGAFVSISGFMAWASVFVAAPLLGAYLPGVHLEGEVWNLPKYVVAVGMILLLLEDQIEHNKHLALHDELTGLPNRRLFQDRLGSALERARRTGTQTALLLVDLNHFKQVNDTFGHHVGDQLLMHVGALFTGRVRRTDTVARIGGDEFALILEEPITREDADRVVLSLLQRLQEPVRLEQYTVRVGASVGIAIFPDDALSAEALCIAADLRMYDHKNGLRRSGSAATLPAGQNPVTAEI